MDRIRASLAPLWAGICWLARDIVAIGKVVTALLVILTFAVLALHFFHVEMSPAIPDVWPIFEPSGLPGIAA